MITFGRTIPNVGYEARFRREMKRMIKAMHKDTVAEISQNFNTLAKDAPLTLTSIMAMLREKWYKVFQKKAREMARWLVSTVGKRSRSMIMQQLKKIDFVITPQYSVKQKELIASMVEEATELIKSIPQKYLRNVQETVRDSFESGGDMHTIKERIKDKIDLPEKQAERRAELIAKDQVNKVTQNFAVEEAKAVGATKGEWIHVAGEFSSRITHVHMDGKTFDLDVGMFDEEVGEYVKPGQLPYCMCQFQAIFPGM